jgi:uncharacterized protein
MHLTKIERLILINQYEIRKALEPNRATYYDEVIEILSRGYAVLYDEVFPAPEMPKSECELVLDVLQMFRAIEAYKKDHPEDTGVASDRWAHFRGFDGHSEADCLQFTLFQLKVKKQWAEQLPYERETDGFNSHSPMKGAYSDMLKVWKSSEERYPLSGEQIRAILHAGGR